MWVQIRITAIGAAFLAGTAAVAYGQDGMTQNPGPIAPGNLPTDRLGSGSASPATGGYGTLGAGDTAAGNWTGTNSGVDRRQTGATRYTDPATAAARLLPAATAPWALAMPPSGAGPAQTRVSIVGHREATITGPVSGKRRQRPTSTAGLVQTFSENLFPLRAQSRRRLPSTARNAPSDPRGGHAPSDCAAGARSPAVIGQGHRLGSSQVIQRRFTRSCETPGPNRTTGYSAALRRRDAPPRRFDLSADTRRREPLSQRRPRNHPLRRSQFLRQTAHRRQCRRQGDQLPCYRDCRERPVQGLDNDSQTRRCCKAGPATRVSWRLNGSCVAKDAERGARLRSTLNYGPAIKHEWETWRGLG